MNLRYFLIGIFFFLAIAPVLLFRAWPYSTVLENEYAEVHERHLLLARNLAAALERYHRDVEATFRLLVENQERFATADQLTHLMENLHLRHVCLADRATGQVQIKLSGVKYPCPDTIPQGVLHRMSEAAIPGRVNFGVVTGAPDGENVIHLAMPYGGDGLAIGAISTRYFRELGAAIAFGVRGHAAIVDHAGNVLAHPLPDWIAERRNIAAVSAVQRMMNGETGVEIFYSPALKGDMIAGFTSVEPVGWGVMIPQPVEELQQKATDARQSTLFVLLLGVAGALALALIISYYASRPLERITAAARRVSKGDLIAPEPSEFEQLLPREFRDLQAGFREMVVRLRESRARINKLAFFDGVTGLGNRECFRRRVQTFLDGADAGDLGAMLFIDLDGFKAVNDTVGHEAGDHVLGQMAERMKLALKAAPFGPEHGILSNARKEPSLARLGGDEFAVFLPQADVAEAVDMAERIRAAIDAPCPYETHTLMLGASIGISCFPGDATDYAGLLKSADIAMYEAKRAGKNGARVYSASPPARRQRRHHLAEDLFACDLYEQIEMHFQPFYRASSMEVAGVEGLIRWLHPRHGVLAPQSFFALVAQLGLQRQIDEFAFDKAITTLVDIGNTNQQPKELTLNIPVERLLDDRFIARVIDVLPLPFRLSFELVESRNSDTKMNQAYWSIDRLRELNIGFALDDFGSSQASINAMLDLAPQRIKLDPRLTSRVVESEGHARLVEAIVRMAHDLEVEVSAKGVESMCEAHILQSLGVDYLQGFGLNPPLLKGELAAHLLRPIDLSIA